MAISDYLNKLIQLKDDLVANLNAKNVTATDDEKFNTLVPKVLEITSTPTVTEYEITGESYCSHRYGSSMSTASLRVNIKNIPNYENLVLWENIFVYLWQGRYNYSISSSKFIDTINTVKDGQYITISATHSLWYCADNPTGSFGWVNDTDIIFKVYVIS